MILDNLKEGVLLPDRKGKVESGVGHTQKTPLKSNRPVEDWGKLLGTARPSTTRLEHRDMLEQRVCRYSSDGNLNEHHRILQNRAAGNGLGRTAQGRIVQRREPETHPRCTRYSVAVWRASDSQTGETTYWVGFQLYWSAVMEFYDAHFTDDIYYRNEWKKSIAPECRGN